MIRGIAAVFLLTGSLFPSVGGLSLVTVGAGVVAFMLLLDWLQTFRLPEASLFGAAAVGGLMASALIWDPVGLYGDDKLGRMWFTLASAVAAGAIAKPQYIKKFAWAWLAAALVLAATASTGINVSGRASGLDENNPVWLGRAIATGIVCLGWLLWTGRLRWLLGSPVMVVLAAGLLATGSRGPMIAATFGLLVVVAAAPRPRGFQRPAIIILGLGAVLLTAFYLPGAGAGQGGVFDPMREVSSTARLTYWAESLVYLTAHVGGAGLGGWSRATAMPAPYPHNLLLEVFVEAGWLWGVALLFVVGAVLTRLVRVRRMDPLVVLPLALLATELVAVSLSGDANGRTFWFLLAVGWAATRWARVKNQGDAPKENPEKTATQGPQADNAAARAGALPTSLGG